jgi:hypothetical protein
MSDEEVLHRIALGRFELRLEHRAAAQVVYVLRNKDDSLWVAIVNRIDGGIEVVSMTLLLARMGTKRRAEYRFKVTGLNKLLLALQTFFHEKENYGN